METAHVGGRPLILDYDCPYRYHSVVGDQCSGRHSCHWGRLPILHHASAWCFYFCFGYAEVVTCAAGRLAARGR